MNIDLLKTFVEISRTRHFSRAAENMFLTTAAVSARIKQLESQLGVSLFIRERGNLKLTLEGEKLLPHAETIIASWARTVQEVKLRPEIDARVHIGTTPGIWLLTLQHKLIDIQRELPEIAIQAEGHDAETLVRMIIEGTVDLALLYDPPASPELKSVKIGEMKLALASSEPGQKLSSAIRQDYIYVDWGTAFANFHAKRLGERAVISLQSNLASIALHIMSESRGAAYLPAGRIAMEDGLYIVKDAPTYRRAIYASYRESSDRHETVQKVLELIHGLSI